MEIMCASDGLDMYHNLKHPCSLSVLAKRGERNSKYASEELAKAMDTFVHNYFEVIETDSLPCASETGLKTKCYELHDILR